MSKELWKQIWESQDKKCAECGKPVALKDTAKSSYSFKIVCQKCYEHPNVHIILDEFGGVYND